MGGITFLFEVDWLSGLGVIGIFLSYKKIWNQNTKLWGVTFLFEVDWLSGYEL